jgi:hypothetical protein
MFGVAKGVSICNVERLQQLNDRLYNRNLPSHTLQASFDPRAVKTRQVLFPVLDCYKPSNTPIRVEGQYNSTAQFNPGSSAPYSGWASNIDNESRVKSLFRTTQKWTPQNEYVPGSQSDLYITNKNVKETSPQETQRILGMRDILFKTEQFDDFNPNKCGLGGDRFNNHTRQQLKNI